MLELFLSVFITQINDPNFSHEYLNQNSSQFISQTSINTQISKPIQLTASRPNIQSKAALIYDINSKTILYSSNPNQKLPIASLTKLITAQIILEEHRLDEIVTVPLEATTIGGSTMNLYAGERISLENLLKGLMINSGNDAAITLGIHNSGSTEKFVQKMNTYAEKIGMKNSHFQNPMGFDSDKNYSTIHDLLTLTTLVLQNPTIQEISNIKNTIVYSTDQKFTHSLRNTNLDLQNFQNINGLKTGTTNLAGQCLIITTDDSSPKIAIVLGSNNRFADTKTMLHWAQTNFKY